MARNNRHNAAFVVGSVIGAVAGAAVALWKTPYTGEELRSKLSNAGESGGGGAQTYTASPATGAVAGEERSIKDKVLSGVEKTLAPIVGVELGKTANGGGAATTLDSGRIKTSPEYGASGATATGAGAERLGLSRDRVDAEKWAQAYGDGAKAPATTSTTPAEPKKTAEASGEYGSTLLRHPHAWKGSGESAQATGTESQQIGLGRNKVDAEKWASAYGTAGSQGSATETTRVDTPAARVEPERATTTSTTTGSTGANVDTGSNVPTGNERLAVGRSRVDADKWAQAYGAGASASSSGTEYPSKQAESEAQTGLGSKPAFPGSDATGHQPADRTAPDTNVADVSRSADTQTADSVRSDENAASVADLTTPQVNRTPDAMQAQGEGGYHPFPKLGGKES